MIELQAQRFADDFIFLEGPKWRDGQLWVSDVFDHCVYSISADGHRRKICRVDRPAGLGFLPDGTLVMVDQKARCLLRLDGDNTILYADLSKHAAGYLNDFAVDGQGRIYVGNFGYDYDAGEPHKTTSLHRVDPDGTVSAAATDVDFPNGSIIINRGRTLIIAETWAGRLTAFDINDRGDLSNRRIFADLGERQPDGICADAEGAIWVSCFNTGEFVRVLDGGHVTHRLQFDGRGVSCALGGADGTLLFLSTYLGSIDDLAAGKRKGKLFTVNVETPGLGFR